MYPPWIRKERKEKTMSESVSYREIHSFMLKKTQEYYLNPPAPLVEAVLAEARSRGEALTVEEAKKRVSTIDIQRLVKQEMQKKWPDFMAGIPQNPLKED